MDRWFAAFLQASAAALCVAAGMVGGDAIALLVPAAGSGVAGLLLWGRSARSAGAETAGREALGTQAARLEELLTSLREDVAQLREDREFYQTLYAGAGETARALGRGGPVDSD